jgi:hypothetical protein
VTLFVFFFDSSSLTPPLATLSPLERGSGVKVLSLFSAMIGSSLAAEKVQNKVERYLCDSSALEPYWPSGKA